MHNTAGVGPPFRCSCGGRPTLLFWGFVLFKFMGLEVTLGFCAQAQHAQAAGAAAVLVYDDQINDYFVPASDGSIAGITIPAGAIPRRTGQLLVSAATVRTHLSYSLLLAKVIGTPQAATACFSESEIAEFGAATMTSASVTATGRVPPVTHALLG